MELADMSRYSMCTHPRTRATCSRFEASLSRTVGDPWSAGGLHKAATSSMLQQKICFHRTRSE